MPESTERWYPMNQQSLSSFIWSVADLLRGDYKQSEYGRVILPFTVLRRLDCVLEPTKAAVLKEKEKREAAGLNPEPFLLKKSGQQFYNMSPLDMKKLSRSDGVFAAGTSEIAVPAVARKRDDDRGDSEGGIRRRRHRFWFIVK